MFEHLESEETHHDDTHENCTGDLSDVNMNIMFVMYWNNHNE